jgi:hypothetical protein
MFQCTVDLGAQYISASPSGQSRYKVRSVNGTVPSSLIDLWFLGLVEYRHRSGTVPYLLFPFLNGNCPRNILLAFYNEPLQLSKRGTSQAIYYLEERKKLRLLLSFDAFKQCCGSGSGTFLGQVGSGSGIIVPDLDQDLNFFLTIRKSE